MSSSKIGFAFGSLSFSGEGEETWLAAQLDKVIDAAPKLSQLRPPAPHDSGANARKGPDAAVGESFTDSLASYIKEKGGDSNQVKRFLATADWLRRRGSEQLASAMVTKALSDNQQKRLSNPADCLNQNVGKGFCEKGSDRTFFITPSGMEELGHK